jgi:hypothetical protein
MIRAVWTGIGEEVVQEDQRRAFLTTAERTLWVDPSGSHPMAPALAINEITREFGIKNGRQIGYSQGWQARGVSEGGYYSIIGISTKRQRLYFVDRGSDIIPTLIVTDAPKEG